MISLPLALVHILVRGVESDRQALEDVETVARACSAALGPGECVVVEAPGEGPHAEVRLGPHDIDVAWVGAAGVRAERTLHFAREEAREERAVAAGLLVAALSASEAARSPSGPPSPSVALPPPSEPAARLSRAAATDREGESGQFEFGAGFSTAMEFDVPTLGGEARFWAPFGVSPFGVTGGVGVHEPLTDGFSVQSVVGSLGPFFSFWSGGPRGPVAFGFLEAFAEAGRASVTREGATETRTFERLGARVGAHLGLPFGVVVPYVGLEGRWLAPRVVVRVLGDELAAAQEFSVAASLGLRFRVF